MAVNRKALDLVRLPSSATTAERLASSRSVHHHSGPGSRRGSRALSGHRVSEPKLRCFSAHSRGSARTANVWCRARDSNPHGC